MIVPPAKEQGETDERTPLDVDQLSATIPRFKTFTDDPTHHVLISCPPDRELWKPVRPDPASGCLLMSSLYADPSGLPHLVQLKDQGVGVYTRELILGGLIRQEVRP